MRSSGSYCRLVVARHRRKWGSRCERQRHEGHSGDMKIVATSSGASAAFQWGHQTETQPISVGVQTLAKPEKEASTRSRTVRTPLIT